MASQHPRPAAAKRPRLSLQTQTPAVNNASRPRTFSVNPSDPTAFNTLSNAYVTAIERSTPTTSSPATAINTLYGSKLTLNTNFSNLKSKAITPFASAFPESPLSAGGTACSPVRMHAYPSVMTPTPPLSAGPVDPHGPKVFVYSQTTETIIRSPVTATGTPLRRFAPAFPAPYVRSHSLRSILRNSPLPPRSALTPMSPGRRSQRLLERAARRVGYNSPIEQEITTNKYTRSHIDLLLEEASPSPLSPFSQPMAVDIARAFTGHEIEDGGQTPGPMEDAARRLSKLTAASPINGGIRKKRRREKKRHWAWTIGKDCEEGEDEEVGGAIAALRAQAAAAAAASAAGTCHASSASATTMQTPDPSVTSGDSSSESEDVDMSDGDSVASSSTTVESGPGTRYLTPGDAEMDMKTPTGPASHLLATAEPKRDTPIPEMAAAMQVS
ncbi:hypothetical protein VHEMI01693 [[Torrubiella] hemipterigena]|uniref:Glucan 4-alpha-glucosidase n=1 Tax=[Torrubiella] hemipterigena TaxID=1531966 RepID=A0A0A1STR9_9HYPO|nr:hypothetical protein VHEMI01693 [[Torrubiella] hemipterigena]